MQNTRITTVDQYFSSVTPQQKKQLETMRGIIKKIAPNAEEVISYGMPAFRYHGILVFYAAWKTHIGFYPSGSGIAEFADQLSGYKTSKGAIQFPLNEPLPAGLISKIVKLRVRQNDENAAAKARSETQKK